MLAQEKPKYEEEIDKAYEKAKELVKKLTPVELIALEYFVKQELFRHQQPCNTDLCTAPQHDQRLVNNVRVGAIAICNKCGRAYRLEKLNTKASSKTESSTDDENCLDCPHWIVANQEEIKQTVGLLIADAGEELQKVDKKILAAAIAEYQSMDI